MIRKLMIILSILTLLSCEAERQHGKVVFISVALDYGAPAGINALENPPEDQRALSGQIEALTNAGGDAYEGYLFLEKNGKRSFNGKAMKWNTDDILRLLTELDTISSDLIIFHYSGHGDEDGSLVIDRNRAAALSPGALLQALSGADGRKCLFIDSCFSGKFIAPSGEMASGEEFIDGNLGSDTFLAASIAALRLYFSTVAAENDSTWIISAATDSQTSFDSWDTGLPEQDRFGAFSYYLAAALGYDMENDKPSIPGRGTEITFYGLYQDIMEMIADDLLKEATPQVTLSPYDTVLFSL